MHRRGFIAAVGAAAAAWPVAARAQQSGGMRRIGWLDNADNDVAVVFTYHGPLVVAIYSNGIEDLSVETFGEIAVSDLLTADNLG